MRVAEEMFRLKSHLKQQLDHALRALARRQRHGGVVDDQRFGDDIVYRHPRVERGIWILEDDLHA